MKIYFIVLSFILAACTNTGGIQNSFTSSNFTKESTMSAKRGKVLSIREYTVDEGDPNYLAIIAGGAIGGLLGNQVGGGTGKKIATVAGAAGGAYAGHKLTEQPVKKVEMQEVRVRDDRGDVYTINQKRMYDLRVGDSVGFEIDGNKATILR